VVLPVALLIRPAVRRNIRTLYRASLLVVLGFVVNRLNVSVTGLEGAQGAHYVPAWSELVITLMLVGVGFAAFGLAVRYLRVYPEERSELPEAWLSPVRSAARSRLAAAMVKT
jgi:Ni/Fe-hydrogenase subunit HybB-like protein